MDIFRNDEKPWPELNPDAQAAWDLYCRETAGSMHVKDFWHELTPELQEHYIQKAKAAPPELLWRSPAREDDHSIWKAGERFVISDQSGERPEDTADGILYVDTSRAPAYCVPRANWELPLLTADGRKVSTVTTTKTICRLVEFGAYPVEVLEGAFLPLQGAVDALRNRLNLAMGMLDEYVDNAEMVRRLKQVVATLESRAEEALPTRKEILEWLSAESLDAEHTGSAKRLRILRALEQLVSKADANRH